MPLDLDFFQYDDLLTEEQRSIRDTLRKFINSEVLPYIGEWCDEGKFPTHLIPQFAEMGLLGPTLPEKYGCAGLDYTSYGLLTQELERGDSGLRSFCSVQSSLCMYPIFEFGSEEQRLKWLPGMAAGKLIGCFGLTEPFGGSNPGGMRVTAKKDGNSWVLNGEKMWITNGSIADLAVVFAQTGEHEDTKTIRAFVVEKGTKGFEAPEIKRKIGLRCSVTSSLVFSDCRIPAANLLPKSEMGIKAALMCLNNARFGIAFGALGAAMGCFEEAVQFTKTRQPFGEPLASYQLIQKKLADIFTNIVMGQGLALRLGGLKDSGKIKPQHISMAKRQNVRMALETARVCREMLGASGITYDYHSGRHETNLISVDTYEGTYDIHTLILGQYITDENAFTHKA
ncbi:MAG: acyl-CoA dehydrogenase family protein [Planctomycetota bacterium]